MATTRTGTRVVMREDADGSASWAEPTLGSLLDSCIDVSIVYRVQTFRSSTLIADHPIPRCSRQHCQKLVTIDTREKLRILTDNPEVLLQLRYVRLTCCSPIATLLAIENEQVVSDIDKLLAV